MHFRTMGPLGANINKYQCPPMQSSDEHFLNYFFSFFFYKKSNDIFFPTFIKFGWEGEAGRGVPHRVSVAVSG